MVVDLEREGVLKTNGDTDIGCLDQFERNHPVCPVPGNNNPPLPSLPPPFLRNSHAFLWGFLFSTVSYGSRISFVALHPFTPLRGISLTSYASSVAIVFVIGSKYEIRLHACCYPDRPVVIPFFFT
jgi:hypothetical protein